MEVRISFKVVIGLQFCASYQVQWWQSWFRLLNLQLLETAKRYLKYHFAATLVGNVAENLIHFSFLILDVFQIMPNHMHAIIALNAVWAGFTPAQNSAQKNDVRAGFTPALYSALYSAQNNDEIYGQSPNGPPQQLPLHLTDNDNSDRKGRPYYRYGIFNFAGQIRLAT